MIDSLAAFLGIKKGVLVAAAVGAFLAALIRSRLQDREKEPRSWLEVFITMMGGFFAAGYTTGPLLSYLEWTSQYESGVAFFIGLFAMAVVDKLLSLLKGLDLEFIKSVFRR